MAKVKDVMTKSIPQIDASATVLVASKAMNENKSSGVAIFQAGKPIGMVTERSILRRFMNLDKKPGQVKVTEAMGPLLKINANASLKEAANKILQNNFTRLGVFDGDKLVGWITLTDIVRESSKRSLVASLVGQNQTLSDYELLCPKCRSAILESQVSGSGELLKWVCPKCRHEE